MIGTLEQRKYERITPELLAREINEFMALLELNTTLELANLLRNPGEDYPSAGLIRNMRLARQQPSARFVKLLRARRKEVDMQLQAGIFAFELAGKVQTVYHVTPKRHLIPILRQGDLEGERVDVNSASDVIAASLSVPLHWVACCAICGRPFLARSSRSRYCYRTDENGVNQCRRQARRLRMAS